VESDLEQELLDGRNAAAKVAQHMEAMGAAQTEWFIPAERGMWKVSVELVVFDPVQEEQHG
jgi:hypothetical protein